MGPRFRGRHGVAELRRRGTPVHGDLADLVPVEAPPTDRRLDDVSEAELLAAAEAILGSLAEAYATLSGRHRLARSQDGSPGATAALASLSRRTVFRVRSSPIGTRTTTACSPRPRGATCAPAGEIWPGTRPGTVARMTSV